MMDKALGLIGIAKRAGRVSGGAELVEDSIRSGAAQLVVIASDISEGSKKAITDCCKHYGVRYITYATKTELGRAIGRDIRAVVSVNDAGLAAAVEARIAEVSEERKG